MLLTLATERLQLRPFFPEDAQDLLAVFREPEAVEYTEWDPFGSEADAAWLIQWAGNTAEQEPRTVFAFAMVIHAGELMESSERETVIGVATLTVRDANGKDASLGYILGKPWWGQGLATEAALCLLRFGFDQLDLHRIHAYCRPANIASARVMEKIGMRREGHLRQNRWEKGAWHDTLLYAILCSDWKDQKK